MSEYSRPWRARLWLSMSVAAPYRGYRLGIAPRVFPGVLAVYMRNHGLVGFAYGVAHMSFFKAFVSPDYNELIAAIGYDVAHGVVIWSVMGAVVPYIMWVIRMKANENDRASARNARITERRIARRSDRG